jgi:hypothetical protein
MNRFPMRPKVRVSIRQFQLQPGYNWEDWPVETYLEMNEMRIYVSAKNCGPGSCAGTLIVDNSPTGHIGGLLLLHDPPQDVWTPDPRPYVEFRYDNLKAPYDWVYAWLSVRARAVEDDLGSDPDDVAENTQEWSSGKDLFEGAALSNDVKDGAAFGLPTKEYMIYIYNNTSLNGNYAINVYIRVTLMNP